MRTRFKWLEIAYRAAEAVAVAGAATALIGLYTEGETSRFWTFLGAWLALVGTVTTLWIARLRERSASRPRQLTALQKQQLTALLSSDAFRRETGIVLRVGTVTDAEAEMFASELQALFAACGVNIYPTHGGAPNECRQLVPHPTGLALTVRDVHHTQPAFLALLRCLDEIGLPTFAEPDETRGPKEAMLVVLKKPA